MAWAARKTLLRQSCATQAPVASLADGASVLGTTPPAPVPGRGTTAAATAAAAEAAAAAADVMAGRCDVVDVGA